MSSLQAEKAADKAATDALNKAEAKMKEAEKAAKVRGSREQLITRRISWVHVHG